MNERVHTDARSFAKDSGRSPSRRARVWLALALVHLVLVAGGAAHFGFWNYGVVGRALDTYGLVSGAASSYPFFAPVVGTSIRARFQLFDGKDFLIATDDLVNGATRETNLRLSNIVEMIDHDISNDGTRRLLASSWAGKIFARHPQATKLKLFVETFDLPTMQEYRQGTRYDWQAIYTANFGRAVRGAHVGSR
jgi:hypothetical protein